MTVKLLTEHHLEFLSFEEGCTGSCESTLVKMPHCWKLYVAAHMLTGWHLPFFIIYFTLVNVYVDVVVFTGIAGTSQTGSGRYWC